jgi:hypothetical protein
MSRVDDCFLVRGERLRGYITDDVRRATIVSLFRGARRWAQVPALEEPDHKMQALVDAVLSVDALTTCGLRASGGDLGLELEPRQ